MENDELAALAMCVIFCLLAGFVGSIYTAPSIPTWYAALQKPSFNPPNWVFFPVWTILYILMGVSLFLVWRQDKHFKRAKTATALFLAQLAANTLWSIVFFGWHDIAGGFIVILILWTLIAATIISFAKASKTAATLLVPYICWVSFATVLNCSILALNQQIMP